ncbi:hypothetical protein [Actinomadura roseirufa]|uniref:hypothetical protein n=1 Tax=Actinomadura roseirufa TaxID=2094049 RepID=UPI001A95569C|nr:hypothetical protein [Actinomadura roseirufa]
MVAVLTGLAAVVMSVTLPTTVAQAVNGDGTSPFASYNMHGSDNGLTWRSEVQRLAADHAVVAIQEAGSGPPLPREDNRANFRQIRLTPNRSPFPSTVTRVTWPAGPNGSDRWVYFLQTDPRRVGESGLDTWDGGQINLATVTDSQADEVRVLENPAYDPDPDAPGNRYRARPLLGLRFGNTWYWNIHARGGDVQGLLNQVRQFAAADGRNWVVVGDYNVNILRNDDTEARGSLHLNDDETLVRTGQPTFINGNNPSELDYAIVHGLTGFTATSPGGAGSDHVPVRFARTPPVNHAPTPSHVFSTVLATPSGRLLQENADRTIGVGDARYDNNQTFQMFTTDALTHYLQNVGTGDCVAAEPDARRDASSRIVAAACDDPRAHWTISHLEDDPGVNDDNGGPQRWQNVAFPGLCLTPSDTSVSAGPCTEDAGQRWWDSPSFPPRDWQTTSTNVRLESAFLGGRIARRGGVANTHVWTKPTPPKSWWIYWWLFEWRDFGWNIQKLSRDDNLVRLQSLENGQYCLGTWDEHATKKTDAMLQECDAPRGVKGAGQRWLAESYADGTIRYRNEANHLCLLAPDGDTGDVTLYECQDIPAERWSVVTP